VKLATFIYSLNMIMKDLSEFVVVTLVVAVMFAEMYFIVHADLDQHGDDLDDLDQDQGSDQGDLDLSDENAFHSPAYAMMSVYMMVFGQFERDWFQAKTKALTAFSVAMFLLYSFFVVIVMLNVLIAIVSDSYDYALTRARPIFLRARLVLVAELDTRLAALLPQLAPHQRLGRQPRQRRRWRRWWRQRFLWRRRRRP